ncbi:TPA: hypothetical protein ENS27_16240 [bacterium]|jgi:GTP-sensing pleiotropic transcriptional regulator CodY|nr:hypothetical protein [bacterium]
MSINALEYKETITMEQARDMILNLFHEKGTLDYAVIFDTLDIDLEIIVNVCEELEHEGIIEEI